MICLHIMDGRWGIYRYRESSTLPSDIPFKKNKVAVHYVTLVPIFDDNLAHIQITPELFEKQSIIIPKMIEDKLIWFESLLL